MKGIFMEIIKVMAKEGEISDLERLIATAEKELSSLLVKKSKIYSDRLKIQQKREDIRIMQETLEGLQNELSTLKT